MYSLQIRGGKTGWNGKKKKKKDIKSCIKIELCKKQKIPSSSPRSLLVISSAFFFELAPGVILRRKIKGKKREFKNNKFAKNFRREILCSKRKKNVIQEAEICYIWFQKHEIGRCKMHININMSRRTNSKCYLQKN